MKYDRFEDLPVWNAAIELAARVYELTKDRVFTGPGDLSSQLRRAALSVSNNIAEGFERGTTAELLTFLYIARGSAGEVRSMLSFVERMVEQMDVSPRRDSASQTRVKARAGASRAGTSKSEISDLKSQIPNPGSKVRDRGFQASKRTKHLRAELANLTSIAESCSRQLRAWAETLQNTEIKGQRHLTRADREQYDAARRAEAFWKQVDAVVEARSVPPGGAHD